MSGSWMKWDRPARLLVQGAVPTLDREEPVPPPSQLDVALRAMQASIGYTVIAELGQYLLDRGVNVADALNRLGLSFMHPWRRLPSLHLLETASAAMAQVTRDLYRTFADPNRPGELVDLVEPEPVLQLLPALSATRIGSNFSLTATNCWHAAYRTDIGADKASHNGITGDKAVVAVIDSGADAGQGLTGWRDLTVLNSSTAQDSIGHGSAMVAIIADVAPNAKLHTLRVTDSGDVKLWDLIAAIDTAVFDVGAHIVNLSLGLPDLSFNCSRCGGGHNGNRSAVFRTRFDRLELGGGAGGAPDPVFVAAVGNDGTANGFHWPAGFSNGNVAAVGAVTNGLRRSAFSNTGTAKTHYFLCPGGEVDSQSNITEWVGEGSDNGATTYCAGTSPATAYASALLALHRQDLEQQQRSFDRKGILDRASNVAANDVSNESGSVRLLFP